jgi:hypothetical protein
MWVKIQYRSISSYSSSDFPEKVTARSMQTAITLRGTVRAYCCFERSVLNKQGLFFVLPEWIG